MFIYVGPFNQPSTVEISGANVSERMNFAAGGLTAKSITAFDLEDDDTALEAREIYPLSLSEPTITKNVVLGNDSNIIIEDDDGTVI